METVSRQQAALLADVLGPSAQQQEIIFAENFLISVWKSSVRSGPKLFLTPWKVLDNKLSF